MFSQVNEARGAKDTLGILFWGVMHKRFGVITSWDICYDLKSCHFNIDRGLGNEELVNSRLAILHQIQKIDNLELKERAQKAKIKWAVEGDENSGFFHGIINKRRNIQNIRGVMVDGNWIESPNDVKKEFFDHFANRFGKPDKPTASI
ncbi:hypothetical protein Tco_0137554, partial [Tanacetum coccineum]